MESDGGGVLRPVFGCQTGPVRAAMTMAVICAVLSSCSNTSPSEEASPLSSPTGESPVDSTPLSTDGSGRTTGDGSEATGRLRVTNRYPFDNRDLPVFPSPDGRMYLDVDGCVVPIAEDSQPACPEGDRWVASASWAPDGSFVVHDQDAFTGGGDSDIHAVFIEDPTGDNTGRAPRARFVNLTEDRAGGESNVDVMPLVVGREVRFLRLSTPPDPPFECEIVTIDLDGAVISSAPTALMTGGLVNPKRAVLVEDRHVVLGTPSTSNQGELITIDTSGKALVHPIDDQSVIRFYGTAGSDAVVMTFNAELESTSGQIRTFDGSSYGTTGLAVTERGFDVLYTIGLDPSAIAFAPDRSEIVAAYSNAEQTTTTLRVWNAADATITDIGTIPVRAVHEIRWVSSDELVVFGDDEILSLQLTT
jgi:hypothetical protein